MAEEEKTTNGQKSLGKDPFEGMAGWNAAETEPEPEEESSHSPFEFLSQEEQPEAQNPLPPAETGTEAEVAETESPDPVETAAETDLEAPPADSPEPSDGTDSDAELVAEPDEQNGQLLDELITTIDDEIDQMFGDGGLIEIGADPLFEQAGPQEQHVIFRLAGSEYAVSAANVREVGDLIHLTSVPNVPAWLLGVTNLRGDVLSVTDLRAFLELEQAGPDEPPSWSQNSGGPEGELMVVHSRQDATLITTGLIVDEVTDIRYLATEKIREPAAPLDVPMTSFLRGVYDYEGHLLVVLDLERLLMSPKMQQFEPS